MKILEQSLIVTTRGKLKDDFKNDDPKIYYVY